jgi:hypothetical protein
VIAQSPECREARRLFDAYLMALSMDDSARTAQRSGDVTARETSAAHEQLKAARSKYWTHVERHKCRSLGGGFVGPPCDGERSVTERLA